MDNIGNEMDKGIEALNAIDLEDENAGIQLLSAFLGLSDESFEIIKPVLLEEFEKSFSSPEVQISFANIFGINNLSIESFNNDFDNIIQAIEEEVNTSISDSKRDFLKTVVAMLFNSMEESRTLFKKTIKIPIELCREGAKLPTYATNGSAAMDLYSPIEFTIHPGETIVVPLGIKVNIPRGYALLIQPRSGMSIKTKLRIPNTPGLIDSDYHEELALIFENISNHIVGSNITEDGIVLAPLYGSDYTIGKGERCAQMRLVEVPTIDWVPVDSIGNFENNHGAGFGSTGIK